MHRATIILFPVILITLLPSSALAHRHYDPEHGRWLQRDPAAYVDGMHLYEYALSSPARFMDPVGLGVSERRAVTDAISRDIGEHWGYTYYRNGLTDLPWLLNTLVSNVRNSRWSDADFVLNPSSQSVARWYAGWATDDRMELSSLRPSPLTVVHEAVHLRHTLLGLYQGTSDYALGNDESIALGVQLMIQNLSTLRRMERRIKSRVVFTRTDCRRVKRMWQIFWQSTNQIIGTEWVTSDGQGTVDRLSVYNIKDHHKFHLSCKKLAGPYNRLIEDRRGSATGCCKLGCLQHHLGFTLEAPFD